jgi:hypothetical protein
MLVCLLGGSFNGQLKKTGRTLLRFANIEMYGEYQPKCRITFPKQDSYIKALNANNQA